MLRIAALLVLAAPATAHEFDDVTIADWQIRDGRFEVHLSDTQVGEFVVCAGYDSAGDLVTSNIGVTANLATKVRVPMGDGIVTAFRCVLNE